MGYSINDPYREGVDELFQAKKYHPGKKEDCPKPPGKIQRFSLNSMFLWKYGQTMLGKMPISTQNPWKIRRFSLVSPGKVRPPPV